jgi:hypothetical protein
MRTTRVGTHVAKLVMLVGAVGVLGGACQEPGPRAAARGASAAGAPRPLGVAQPAASPLGWRPGAAETGVGAPDRARRRRRHRGAGAARPGRGRAGAASAVSPAAMVAGGTGRAAELRLLAAFARAAGDAGLADAWVDEAEATARPARRPRARPRPRCAGRRRGAGARAPPAGAPARRAAVAAAGPTVHSVSTGAVVADSARPAPEPASAAPRKAGGVRGALRRAARWLSPGRRAEPAAAAAPVRPTLPLPATRRRRRRPAAPPDALSAGPAAPAAGRGRARRARAGPAGG